MKRMVISLGGSILSPEGIDPDYKFLKSVQKTLKKHYSKYSFVIVTGGGSIARKYISLLKSQHRNEKQVSLAGIRGTRMNALTLMQFFGKDANETLPKSMKQVESMLGKNRIVCTGALRYRARETSDGTASQLASYLKAPFINITNVPGLYTSDPRKNKDAKFIGKISWKDFEKKAHHIHFKPGQHFVLDQKAATDIRKNKVTTYIIGKNVRSLAAILENKKFQGTLIEG